jgi:hypothetical protein
VRVENVRVVPVRPDRTRLEATVRYADRRRRERVWFDVPDAIAGGLDGATGNAFLAVMLPLAVALEQALEIDAPVDEVLRRGAVDVQAQWSTWYGTRADLAIRAPAAPPPASTPTRTMAFFSGGVDSTFTALRGAGLLDGSTPTLDELVFIGGFDVPLGERRRLATVRARVEAAAREIGLPLVSIRTNVRETRWREADWRLLAHGPLLAASALALGRRYGAARIASSVWAGRDAAWGSHPAVVDRLATSTLRVREDGVETDRMPKLRAIAHHPATRRLLRVCWQSASGENCGRCRKCVVARVQLDLVCDPDACPCIPRAPDLLALLRALPADSGDERATLCELHDQAVARGRDDVAAATVQGRTSAPIRDLTTPRRPRSMRPRWWHRFTARRRG